MKIRIKASKPCVKREFEWIPSEMLLMCRQCVSPFPIETIDNSTHNDRECDPPED